MQRKFKVLSVIFYLTLIGTTSIDTENWEKDLVLAHEDCNKFYKYFNRKPLLVICSEGLYFNIKHRPCDWKHNVDCIGRNVPDETSYSDDEIISKDDSESEDIDDEEIDIDNEPEKVINTDLGFFHNGCPVNPLISWLLPFEMDCNQFYYCLWGIKIKRQCPAFHHFNKRLQICDWPRVAGCA